MNILETKGIQYLEYPKITFKKFLQLLKIKKVNIGSPENPKFYNIGDYYDHEIIGKNIDLLHEF